MSEIAARRRRWPWGVISVIVLVVGVPLAWKFRPLNATERKLLGTWESSPKNRLSFHADRRFYLSGATPGDPVSEEAKSFIPPLEFGGTWTASGNSLYRDGFSHLDMPWQDRLTLFWATLTEDAAESVIFDGPNQIRLRRVRYDRLPQ